MLAPRPGVRRQRPARSDDAATPSSGDMERRASPMGSGPGPCVRRLPRCGRHGGRASGTPQALAENAHEGREAIQRMLASKASAPWFTPPPAELRAWRGVQSSAPPWSARPSHACWLTWSSWAAACSGGPSWRPTSKRFRVRAGSLRLSSRRLLSAALLAVRRRWQGERCDEADDGEGRNDGGGGAEHPQREAEGRRVRDPGGAHARRAHGL